MKFWYICALEHESCELAFIEKGLRAIYADTLLFCMGDRNARQNNIITVFNENQQIKNAMDEPFASAWALCEKVCSYAQESGFPDVICVQAHNAIGSFLFQHKLQNEAMWGACVIILDKASTVAAIEYPQYLLPYYWVNRQNELCELAADAVIEGALSKESVFDAIQRAKNAEKRQSYPLLTSRAQAPVVKPEELIKGMVTVIVPYYNLGKTLPQTLKSLELVQYDSCEIILIDDGSTDAQSVEVLAQMEKQYPKMQIIRKENAGLGAVRNLGASVARGEFITYLDADDMVSEQFFAKSVELLNRYSNISYVSSWFEMFGEAEGLRVFFSSSLPELLVDNMQGCTSVCRTAVIRAFGRNIVGVTGFEDHEYWINLAQHGHFGVCIPKPHFKYRISAASMSGTIGHEKGHYKQMKLFQMLTDNHQELYKEYAVELFNLLTANGPGFLWNSECVESGILRLEKTACNWQREFTLAREHINNLENSKLNRLAGLLKKRNKK